MSRHVDLPTDDAAAAAVAAALTEADATGHRVSVLAVAAQLGLTNTTFRRHYPHLAQQIGEQRRIAAQQPADASRSETGPHTAIAALRRSNQQLTDQLGLAVASIQRLALDNHRLHEQLEAVSNITRLPRR